ncbi:MAG: hypothetical protein ABIR36_03985, partial [Nitrospiraceae bacterium]
GFDFIRSTFAPNQNNPVDIKDWIDHLIKLSGNDEHFRNKITPWVDAGRGARPSVCRNVKDSPKLKAES